MTSFTYTDLKFQLTLERQPTTYTYIYTEFIYKEASKKQGKYKVKLKAMSCKWEQFVYVILVLVPVQVDAHYN